MFDAIIVGGRVAGASAGMLLARHGHRVLIVDSDRFPSDTLSTHILHISGGSHLHEWGLLDALAATGCPPIERATLNFGGFALSGRPTPSTTTGTTYCPRRTVLDTLLVEAAAAAGAEVRQGFRVHELLRDGDRVVGVRGRDADGLPVTERAALVIGADGARSRVADAVDAGRYHEEPALTFMYYSYWSGVPTSGVELYPREDRAVSAFPTHDGLTCVVASGPRGAFHEFRHDIESNFLAALALVPELAERVRTGRREERFRGTADLDNFFRVPHGPGWALVGDAGCHKDPMTAQGMSDALRDAALLADAVHQGLVDGAMRHQLDRYHRRRDETELPRYRFSLDMARFGPPQPEQAALFGALAGNPGQIERFLGVFAGTVDPAEFFAPDNIASIVAAA